MREEFSNYLEICVDMRYETRPNLAGNSNVMDVWPFHLFMYGCYGGVLKLRVMCIVDSHHCLYTEAGRAAILIIQCFDFTVKKIRNPAAMLPNYGTPVKNSSIFTVPSNI